MVTQTPHILLHPSHGLFVSTLACWRGRILLLLLSLSVCVDLFYRSWCPPHPKRGLVLPHSTSNRFVWAYVDKGTFKLLKERNRRNVFNDFSPGLFWYILRIFTNLPAVYSSIKSSRVKEIKKGMQEMYKQKQSLCEKWGFWQSKII